jgi:hypothetical protein
VGPKNTRPDGNNGWGEIFSLFPSTLTDTFGAGNATRNYDCLYIAQGIGSIFGGPMAALLHDNSGSWATVFAVAIAADTSRQRCLRLGCLSRCAVPITRVCSRSPN